MLAYLLNPLAVNCQRSYVVMAKLLQIHTYFNTGLSVANSESSIFVF